jgi:Transglycosylase SLT domain/UDP-glucose/GDP-mannose dehydrogenase family, NAD binding domain
VQTAEPELNNLDDHKQPSSTLDSFNVVCHSIESAASAYDLPLGFLTRLIWQESRFDVGAVSPVGAHGLVRFMPGTAIQTGLANPFDAIEAIPKSAELLRNLKNQFGNLGLATAAYNAGPKRIQNGHADLSYVYAVARDIAAALDGFTLVVTKSTVPVGTGDEVERIIREARPNADVR